MGGVPKRDFIFKYSITTLTAFAEHVTISIDCRILKNRNVNLLHKLSLSSTGQTHFFGLGYVCVRVGGVGGVVRCLGTRTHTHLEAILSVAREVEGNKRTCRKSM